MTNRFKQFIKDIKNKIDLSKIKKKYKYISRMGVGAYGVVYKALNKKTGEVVAIKLFINKRIAYKKELDILLDLKNKGICEKFICLNDYGDYDEIQYISFSFIDGETLDKLINNGITKEKSEYILKEIIKSVILLHKNNISHQDLKPENIMVVNNKVFIIDLGLACNKEVCDIGGTPGYMSKTKLNKTNLNFEEAKADDIYSIGIIAKEMKKMLKKNKIESKHVNMIVKEFTKQNIKHRKDIVKKLMNNKF
jgi:serine/threonine protein kinase